MSGLNLINNNLSKLEIKDNKNNFIINTVNELYNEEFGQKLIDDILKKTDKKLKIVFDEIEKDAFDKSKLTIYFANEKEYYFTKADINDLPEIYKKYFNNSFLNINKVSMLPFSAKGSLQHELLHAYHYLLNMTEYQKNCKMILYNFMSNGEEKRTIDEVNKYHEFLKEPRVNHLGSDFPPYNKLDLNKKEEAFIEYIRHGAQVDALHLANTFEKDILKNIIINEFKYLINSLLHDQRYDGYDFYYPLNILIVLIVEKFDGNFLIEILKNNSILLDLNNCYPELFLGIIKNLSLDILTEFLKIQSRDSNTILHLIAQSKPDLLLGIVEKLPPADLAEILKIQNRDRNTILHLIAQSKPDLLLEIVKKLLPADLAETLKIQDGWKNTILHLIAQSNPDLLLEIVEKLPSADLAETLKIQYNDRNTMLHLIKNHNSKTLLKIVKKLPNNELAEILKIQDKAGNTILHLVKNHDSKVLLEIIEKLSSDELTKILKIQNNYGDTILYWVAHSDERLVLKIAEKLKPAELAEILKIQNKSGITIRHLVKNHNLDLLLDQSANKNFPRQLPQNYSFKYWFNV